MIKTPVVIGVSAEMTNFSINALKQGLRVGFVPTMGALHDGHISLVREAKKNCDVVVVSIFVNPTQFNDPKDYERYPRTIENDVHLLSLNGCDAVFVPKNLSEVYPDGYVNFDMSLGNLEHVMEGAHRPGHFKGVLNVVSRLFELVQPSASFFGLKDYQQYLVIKRLIEERNFNIELHGIEISRSEDGLARSSRNQLLTAEEFKLAPNIFKLLSLVKDLFGTKTIEELKKIGESFFSNSPEFKLEYFEFADGNDLQLLTGFGLESELPMAFIAVKLGKIRLIDNIFLKSNITSHHANSGLKI